jgi:hypothetical protein
MTNSIIKDSNIIFPVGLPQTLTAARCSCSNRASKTRRQNGSGETIIFVIITWFFKLLQTLLNCLPAFMDSNQVCILVLFNSIIKVSISDCRYILFLHCYCASVSLQST